MPRLLLLLTTLAWAEPPPAGDARQAGGEAAVGEDAPQAGADAAVATLAAEGEAIGPAVVTKIELHPEFQRYHLAVGEAALAPVELVQKPPLRQGVCAAHDLTLFPRWELSGPVPEDPWIEGERTPRTDEERVHELLCQRLAAWGAEVLLGAPQPAGVGAGEKPPPAATLATLAQTGPLRLHWLHLPLLLAVALGLGCGLAGARALDRAGRRDLLLVTGLSLAARLLLSPRQLFNGALAGWEKVVFAWGLTSAPDVYGAGWGALMGPLHAAFGLHPAVTWWGNLGLAALAAPALYAALRALAGPDAARLGGLLLAVLPLHLRLSATEVMTVPVVTLVLVAVAGAARSGRPAPPGQGDALGTAAGALAGLAAGLAAHVRPEALLVLPAVAAAPLVAGGRAAALRAGPWLGLLLGGALVAMRLLELPSPSGPNPLSPHHLASPTWWLAAAMPGFASARNPVHIALDASWTSPLLWLGAALALGRARRAALPWLLWLPGTVLILTKSWPLADALRLQLVAAPAWVGLGAVGLAVVLRDRPRRRALEGGAVLLVALPALTWPALGPRLDLARHHEAALLLEVAPALPPGARVLYDDVPVRGPDLAAVLAAINPRIQLLPASQAPLAEGMLLVRGTSCVERLRQGAGEQPLPACARVEAACTLEPLHVRAVPARTDLDTEVVPERVAPDGTVEVGVYTLRGC